MDSDVQQRLSFNCFTQNQPCIQTQHNEWGRQNNQKKIVYYYLHETDFHGVSVEEADLLGCCAIWSGNLFSKFRLKVLPSFSGLWVNSQTPNSK
jgi:hypothetical protein